MINFGKNIKVYRRGRTVYGKLILTVNEYDLLFPNTNLIPSMIANGVEKIEITASLTFKNIENAKKIVKRKNDVVNSIASLIIAKYIISP